MTLSLEDTEKAKLQIESEADATSIKVPSTDQDKAALDDLLGFLDTWEKEGADAEELETEVANNIVSIPKSLGIDYEKAMGKSIRQEETNISSSQEIQEDSSKFRVYDDEIPPIPLDDYTPMEIEEDETLQEPKIVQEQATFTELPSSEQLPSLEELPPPDFNTDFMEEATEYDTQFVLDKESQTFENVLKDLGWDEEED